jgi:hypothetical protein
VLCWARQDASRESATSKEKTVATFPLTLPGFEGQSIVVEAGSAFAGPKLLVNGQPAPKGPKRGSMLLQRNAGQPVVASWKPVVLGLDTPEIVVDGQTIQLQPPLPWYAWVWSALPILLIAIGGAFGALVGVIATNINVKIFRSSSHLAAKFILSALVSGGAIVGYIALAVALSTMLGR